MKINITFTLALHTYMVKNANAVAIEQTIPLALLTYLGYFDDPIATDQEGSPGPSPVPPSEMPPQRPNIEDLGMGLDCEAANRFRLEEVCAASKWCKVDKPHTK